MFQCGDVFIFRDLFNFIIDTLGVKNNDQLYVIVNNVVPSGSSVSLGVVGDRLVSWPV